MIACGRVSNATMTSVKLYVAIDIKLYRYPASIHMHILCTYFLLTFVPTFLKLKFVGAGPVLQTLGCATPSRDLLEAAARRRPHQNALAMRPASPHFLPLPFSP